MSQFRNGKPAAAFIKRGSFSHVNESVLAILTNNFPQYQIDVYDVFNDLIKPKDFSMILHGIKHYRNDLIRGRKSIKQVYIRTPHFFKKVRYSVRRKLANKNYAFTFQTQSLFDASLPNTPHFLYTDHTHLANKQYPAFNENHLFSNAWIECERALYESAQVNFTMSTNISTSIIEDYGCDPSKVALVYCGSNIEVKRDETFDSKRYAGKNILFVGVEWERKGGPALAEAFLDVLKTHPDATLTIVGCSPDINLPNCHVVGKIPLPEVKFYFERAAIFCLPTTLEPFGIVFLEAMAHKLPIVATNLGAIPDFIEDDKNGYKVEPNNTKDLCRHLNDLLASPEKCAAFGEYGHDLLWKRYNWERTGERIKENISSFL